MVEKKTHGVETHPAGDRRSGKERRQGDDRRDLVRYEPDKTNRRGGKDRRKQGGPWE